MIERAQNLFERIPVRWRIAAATAGLTMAILVLFAAVLGNLVGDRIRADFDDELRYAAKALASETRVDVDPLQGRLEISSSAPRLDDFAMAEDAVISVVGPRGEFLDGTDRGAILGPPVDELADRGELRVASEPLESGSVRAFVQYARPDADMEQTISRLWFFLAAGVIGGTVLALLAGLAIADRAMRPIASLTALARDITTTRDPSQRMPVPAADDEVGELARTMDGMLEALDDARTEQERMFERQREFVADASHELRTPLTSVHANLELLRDSLPGGEDRHAAESALASTKRMSRLVSDLLLLARADAGRRTARTEVDLARATRAAIDEVRPIAEDHEISADIEPLLGVEGNPDELHRLVLNLIENAVRHTPPETKVHVAARADGGQAVIEVADDGPGLPDGLGDQVFARFVRGEGPSDTAAGGGSGLGLAIVRAVAASHGGSVEADSSEAGGARFTVELPLARFQPPPLDSPSDETPSAPAETPLARRTQR